MSFYQDFLDEIDTNDRVFRESNRAWPTQPLYPAHELKTHAEEIGIFNTIGQMMRRATIIRLRGDQSEIFLETPIIEEQDYIQWLRLPYPILYIQPEQPFRFTGYAPKSEEELAAWAKSHANALTGEERYRLEEIRREGDPMIRGALIADLTDQMHRLPQETLDIFRAEFSGLLPVRVFHVTFLMPVGTFLMNIHSFTMMVTQDNQLFVAKRLSMPAMLNKAKQWLVHLINFLSSPSIKLVPNQPDAALQKARAKKGKPPLPGWYEITLAKVIKEYGKEKKSLQLWHHSFRYSVRGHFRRYETGRMAGRVSWIPAHERGLANAIYRPKGYRTQA